MNTSIDSPVLHTPIGALSTAKPGVLSRLRVRRLAANYLSTLGFIALSYWIVTSLSQFHQSILQAQWQLGMFDIDAVVSVHAVFIALIALYAVILLPYYAVHPWMRSKSLIFVQGLGFALERKRRAHTPRTMSGHTTLQLPIGLRLSTSTRQAGLALLLKFFFAPLMINWCLNHIANLSVSLMQLAAGIESGIDGRMLFDTSFFWAAFQLILFVDTLLFTLGYIVEVPALGNRIRSVDPTFFGWFICLACYPPFNEFTLRFLEWQSSDFPYFANDFVHVGINMTLLIALAIYSWASIALGFKASNLTNRGIVTHGPYAFVRHPAYAAKNLAWWLGALPVIGMAFASGNWKAFAYSLLALFGWTAIYVLRALTEERHLLMGNNGYAQYAQRVRWRLIPGIW